MSRAILPGPANGLTIGVMGGSFDPAHSGHAHVIDVARRALKLDQVWVLVAPGNPLKKTGTKLDERLAGAGKLLASRTTRVSAFEHDAGLIYTIDTLRALKRLAPTACFVWLMGGDSLRDFHRWKSWQAIARLVPIAVIARPGASPKAGLSRFARQFADARLPSGAAPALASRRAPAWVYLPAPFNPASSTAIRNRKLFAPTPPA
jgi:nicotinate-nucleotide adenylyltransferase